MEKRERERVVGEKSERENERRESGEGRDNSVFFAVLAYLNICFGSE